MAYDVRTYAYLRNDINWNYHKCLDAVAIMNFPKDDKKQSNPLVVLVNAGLTLTPKLERIYQNYVHTMRSTSHSASLIQVTRFLDQDAQNKMLGHMPPAAKTKAAPKASGRSVSELD